MASGAAHWPQNLMPAGLSCWHREHHIVRDMYHTGEEADMGKTVALIGLGLLGSALDERLIGRTTHGG